MIYLAYCCGALAFLAFAFVVIAVVFRKKIATRAAAAGPNKMDNYIAQRARVLKNATFTIHAIKRIPVPQKAIDENKPATETRNFFCIEATIGPTPGHGGMDNRWQIDSLYPVLFDAQALTGDTFLWTVDRSVLVDGKYIMPKNHLLSDSQRIRLIFGAQPTTTRAKFCYISEFFGDFTLPHDQKI